MAAPLTRRRQVVLFLVAVVLPSTVLVALGIRLISQDGELQRSRLADDRRAALSEAGRLAIVELEDVEVRILAALDESLSLPSRDYPHPAVRFVAREALHACAGAECDRLRVIASLPRPTSGNRYAIPSGVGSKKTAIVIRKSTNSCVSSGREHEKFHRFASEVQDLVELPRRVVDLLVRFLEQGDGKVSGQARQKEFAAPATRRQHCRYRLKPFTSAKSTLAPRCLLRGTPYTHVVRIMR